MQSVKVADFLANIKAHVGNGYWYGTYAGQLSSESLLAGKSKQYPKQYTDTYVKRSRRWLDGANYVPPTGYSKTPNAPAGTPVMDCVGLIKGTLWQMNGIRYESASDLSANGWYAKCPVKGTIASIPDKAGIVVHRDQHIGVYIGDGLVIESRGVDYGVVVTKLSERPWTGWGESAYVDYFVEPIIDWEAEAKRLAEENAKLKVELTSATMQYNGLKSDVQAWTNANRALLEV